MTRCRRTKAVRKWVAVMSHPFFGSGFCWPESSSLPLIAHADDGTCIHTRTARAHLLLIWNSKGTLLKPRRSSREFPRMRWKGGKGLSLALFFSLSLSHTYTLSLSLSLFFPFFTACFELSRSENLCFLERTTSTPLEDPWEPFAAGTVKRQTKVLKSASRSRYSCTSTRTIVGSELERLIPRNFLKISKDSEVIDGLWLSTLRTNNLRGTMKCCRNTVCG